MAAPHTGRANAARIFNHLRYGQKYRAITRLGTATGEFLGVETPHGDWALLFRHSAGTESIPLADVHSITPAPSATGADALPSVDTVCA